MSSPPPLPQPSAGDHRVRLGTVVAALAKLNIEISIEDLLQGIREVEEASRPSKFTAIRNLPPQLTESTASLNLHPVAKPIPNPTKPANPNPLAEQHRRFLLELAEQIFPNVARFHNHPGPHGFVAPRVSPPANLSPGVIQQVITPTPPEPQMAPES